MTHAFLNRARRGSPLDHGAPAYGAAGFRLSRQAALVRMRKPGAPPRGMDSQDRPLDPATLDEELARHRARLLRMIDLRLDRRLRCRIDPSDVVQETFVEASQRWDEFQRNPQTSAFLWLRFLTCQKIGQLHRAHLGAQARDVRREVRLDMAIDPEASSLVLAGQLAADLTSPTQASVREEEIQRVMRALDSLPATDCEILALRQFEQLSNFEAAEVLGLDTSAASKRYLRALERLRRALDSEQGPH